MTLYPKLIMDALATVRYPGNGKNIVEAEMVASVRRASITALRPSMRPSASAVSWSFLSSVILKSSHDRNLSKSAGYPFYSISQNRSTIKMNLKNRSALARLNLQKVYEKAVSFPCGFKEVVLYCFLISHTLKGVLNGPER